MAATQHGSNTNMVQTLLGTDDSMKVKKVETFFLPNPMTFALEVFRKRLRAEKALAMAINIAAILLRVKCSGDII